MKKSKILVSLSLIFASFLLAFIIETFFFNGIRMHEIKDNKGIISLKNNISFETETTYTEILDDKDDSKSLFGIETNDEVADNALNTESDDIEKKPEFEAKEINVLKIKIDKMYMDRIVINYKTDSDMKLSLKIKKFNEYGNPVYEQISLVLLKEFNTVTKVIENDAADMEILLDYDDNISLNIYDVSVKNEFNFNMNRFMLMVIFFVTIAVLFILRKIVFKKIEYLFVIIAMCTGMALIYSTPCLTLYSCDDHIHLDRMYSLFETGEIKTSKAFDYSRNLRLYMKSIPTSYEDFHNIHDYLNKNSNVKGQGIVNDNKFISYVNYTYIPSAIIISVSKFLNLPYTMLFHLGKIMNLIIYVLVMYYAIKHAKIGKKLLFVLALLPSTIFLASQYSRDAIITAGIYLAISTFLNCYCTNEKMDRKNLLIFILSILIASLSKAIYVPYLLLLLLMPKEKFSEKRNAKWIKILVILLLIVSMSTFILPAASSSSGTVSDIRGGDASTGTQLELIKEQPVAFAKVFSKYVVNELSTEFTYNQTLGRWHEFTIIRDLKYYALLIIVLLCAICSTKDEKVEKLDKKVRISLILLSIFITCLICGSMYLSFTPVAYTTITGVQSRYYIPLLFGTYIALKQSKIRNNFNEEKIMMIISGILLYIYFFMIYNGIIMNVAA